SERTVSQQSVVAELIPQLRRIPGLSISAVNPPSLGQSRGSRPVEFVIQTSGTYEELQGYVAAVMERVKDYPGLVNLDSDLKLNKPELRVELDRARVSDLGLDVALIGRTLETLLGSRQVTRFEWNGEQYDVLLQLADADRTSPEVLDTIFLR